MITEAIRGSLYISKHNELRQGRELEFKVVILATDTVMTEQPSGYPKFAGTIVSNDDTTSSLSVGIHSDTWNADQFEPYEQSVTVLHKNSGCGDSCPG